ncbi:MAG: 6-bladed beta-propeller [Nitrososphaerales archaeon]
MADAETFLFSIPSGVPVLTSVSDVAVDSGGNIIAVTNDNLVKLNPTGTEIWRIGSSGSGDGQLSSPQGVAVDGTGNIYVADTSNHRIQKFNSAGVYQSQFGSPGSGNGQFNLPQGVTVDGTGNIYVADTSNHRIQKFNSTGAFVSKFGSLGSGNGQLSSPQGVTVDNSSIYVVDTNNNRIQVFVQCIPPPSGNWIITSNCTMSSSASVTMGDVIVRNNAVLTIPNNVLLDIDFTQHHLLVEFGSGILIKVGGKIF